MKLLINIILIIILPYQLLLAKPKVFTADNVKITEIPVENVIQINFENYILSPNIKIVDFNNNSLSISSLKKGDIVDIKYKTGEYSEEFPYKSGTKAVFFIKKKFSVIKKIYKGYKRE